MPASHPKSWSEMLPSDGLGLGTDAMGQKGITHKKFKTKIKNFFFIADPKTC